MLEVLWPQVLGAGPLFPELTAYGPSPACLVPHRQAEPYFIAPPLLSSSPHPPRDHFRQLIKTNRLEGELDRSKACCD